MEVWLVRTCQGSSENVLALLLVEWIQGINEWLICHWRHITVSYTWTTLITMSEQFKYVPHGTNSPPLEATGEDKPMGASCIAGTQQAGHVSDAEQRRGEMDFFCFRLSVCFSWFESVNESVCLYLPLFIRIFPWIGECLAGGEGSHCAALGSW